MGSYLRSIYLMQILMWHHRPGYILQSLSRRFLKSQRANICHVAPPGPFLILVNVPDCIILEISFFCNLFLVQKLTVLRWVPVRGFLARRGT